MHLPRTWKWWLMVEQDCIFECVRSLKVLIVPIGGIGDGDGVDVDVDIGTKK